MPDVTWVQAKKMAADAGMLLADWQLANPSYKITATGTPSSTTPSSDPFTSPGPVDVQPGLDWLSTQEGYALQKYIADLNAAVDREQVAAQKDIVSINASHDSELAAQNAALQRDLQSGRITADEYMQKTDLAQRESEFARSFQLNERAQAHTEVIDGLKLDLQRYSVDLNDKLSRDLQTGQITSNEFMQARELAQREIESSRAFDLGKAAEVRQERTLQAQLASNPADTVLYEFYKRGLGQPTAQAAQPTGAITPAAATATQNFLGGKQAGAEASAASAGTSNGMITDISGYASAPPAYSDQSLQDLARSIFEGQNRQYNPNLSGTGAFGANIAAPNEISHSQFAGLDPNQLAVLSSFLKAGIQVGPNGERVAINPEDYFQQMQRSWIPATQGAVTAYA